MNQQQKYIFVAIDFETANGHCSSVCSVGNKNHHAICDAEVCTFRAIKLL